MLLDYALPKVTPYTYQVSSGRSSSGGDGTGADTQPFCGGIPRSKSESALNFVFFFFGDWRKSMRAHNEKHRKKLAWPISRETRASARI